MRRSRKTWKKAAGLKWFPFTVSVRLRWTAVNDAGRGSVVSWEIRWLCCRVSNGETLVAPDEEWRGNGRRGRKGRGEEPGSLATLDQVIRIVLSFGGVVVRRARRVTMAGDDDLCPRKGSREHRARERLACVS